MKKMTLVAAKCWRRSGMRGRAGLVELVDSVQCHKYLLAVGAGLKPAPTTRSRVAALRD